MKIENDNTINERRYTDKMREVTKTYYEASDGKLFDNKIECAEYEEELKKVKYFRVDCSLKLEHDDVIIESPFYIAVHAEKNHERFIELFCGYLLGKRYYLENERFDSDSIIENWSYSEIDSPDNISVNIKDFMIKIEDACTEMFIWDGSIRSLDDLDRCAPISDDDDDAYYY